MRREDIEITVDCELQEFYSGALKEINYGRSKMLPATEGSYIKNQILKIEILPGYGEHTSIRYPKKGHESFGSKPSDLIVKFKLIPKANYVRQDNDLIYTHTLTLIEALELKPFIIQTLDSRKVTVTPSEVISPQTELRVAGEGMPFKERGDVVIDTQTVLKPKSEQKRGDLIVKFNILFPKKILMHNRQTMLEALAANLPFKV